MKWWHIGLPVFLALVINSAGLAVISFRLNNLTSPQPEPDQTTKQRLEEIYKDIQSIRNEISQNAKSMDQKIDPILGTSVDLTGQLSDLLGDAPATNPAFSSPITGYISVSDPSKPTVDVYKENASFSPVIDKIVFGQKYPFHSRLNNWYLITLPSGKTGWVQAAYVKQETGR